MENKKALFLQDTPMIYRNWIESYKQEHPEPKILTMANPYGKHKSSSKNMDKAVHTRSLNKHDLWQKTAKLEYQKAIELYKKDKFLNPFEVIDYVFTFEIDEASKKLDDFISLGLYPKSENPNMYVTPSSALDWWDNFCNLQCTHTEK